MQNSYNAVINGGDLAMMDFDLTQPEAPVRCPLCHEMFVVVPSSQPLQQHLLTQHRLIIAKIDEIADLRQYLMYWGKLEGADLTQFCSAILTNSDLHPSHGKPERYYLLSEHLPEDKRLRDMLREIKLRAVTRTKELERADTTFSRKCVYCYKIIGGGLHAMFDHLTIGHNFSIGQPDNIVFGAKLLDAMEAKLQKLICVYCEKQFTDVEVLRLHMRKKGHRTLNPDNRFYDQFYLINYLQPGTPWQEVKHQQDEETASQTSFTGDSLAGGVGVSHSLDEQWRDWREEETQSATCLFCSYTTCKLPGGLLQHMITQHDCDLLQLTKDFSFYDKVKAVNYIRSKMLQGQCPSCSKSPGSHDALQEHLRDYGHCKLPTPALWCSKKYLQPVLEEDGLLCHLDDCPETELSDLEHRDVSCDVFPDGDTDAAALLSAEVRRSSGLAVTCLFCRHTALGGPALGCNGVRELVDHMHNMHSFDLYQMTLGLNFYDQICLINFIRRRSAEGRCYYCNEGFSDPRLLEEHRTLQDHTGAPDPQLYRLPEFMSPALEDDPLLLGLDQLTWNTDSDLEDDVIPSPTSQDESSCIGKKKCTKSNKNIKKNKSIKSSRTSHMLPDVVAHSLLEDMSAGMQLALTPDAGACHAPLSQSSSPAGDDVGFEDEHSVHYVNGESRGGRVVVGDETSSEFVDLSDNSCNSIKDDENSSNLVNGVMLPSIVCGNNTVEFVNGKTSSHDLGRKCNSTIELVNEDISSYCNSNRTSSSEENVASREDCVTNSTDGDSGITSRFGCSADGNSSLSTHSIKTPVCRTLNDVQVQKFYVPPLARLRNSTLDETVSNNSLKTSVQRRPLIQATPAFTPTSSCNSNPTTSLVIPSKSFYSKSFRMNVGSKERLEQSQNARENICDQDNRASQHSSRKANFLPHFNSVGEGNIRPSDSELSWRRPTGQNIRKFCNQTNK